MNKFNYKYLTPFKWFVIENFPFIEADFDAITEWQLFEKLGNEINKIINSQNQVGTEMEILSNAFIELQNYVNNYFDNLDLQEEVDTKLNEMAESGELTDIIAQYLQLQGLLCYNTKNDMKNAENLANGSFAKTYGTTTYNDGDGYFYKIRELLNTDLIDDENIIALANYPTLIAEKINSYLDNDIDNLQEQINQLKNRKFIFIGDSYNTNDTPQGGTQITPWGTLVAQYLGLSQTDYFNSGVSGAGWCVPSNTFLDQLEALDTDIENKEEITDIFVLGGINDNPYTLENIYQGIIDFADYAKTNYPNAMVTIGLISWTKYLDGKIKLAQKLQYYNNSSIKTNMRIITNAHNWYHIIGYSQDDGHPNLSGSTAIAYNLANYIKGGVCEQQAYYEGTIYKDNNNIAITSDTVGTLKQALINNNVYLLFNFNLLTLGSNSIEPSTSQVHTLGSFDNQFINVDSDFPITTGYVWGYDATRGKYVNMQFTLFINGNLLKIKFYNVNETSGTVAHNFTVLDFQKLPPIVLPTILT